MKSIHAITRISEIINLCTSQMPLKNQRPVFYISSSQSGKLAQLHIRHEEDIRFFTFIWNKIEEIWIFLTANRQKRLNRYLTIWINTCEFYWTQLCFVPQDKVVRMDLLKSFHSQMWLRWLCRKIRIFLGFFEKQST